ncbi:conserved Plasmodium protein, unknown function [Plasmodium malariae]|uniref:Sulfhydryl oxidase n=2 Tax=Plasmodium malariae TaxID=5858 RepID=A0A1D3PA07_PLAMA|nr:conserved Plasmodium protein, unknown function [Plasmodium malariae]SCN12059.1 conserved Plasmodium protein, unknown function [Plasmodium malariae]
MGNQVVSKFFEKSNDTKKRNIIDKFKNTNDENKNENANGFLLIHNVTKNKKDDNEKKNNEIYEQINSKKEQKFNIKEQISNQKDTNESYMENNDVEKIKEENFHLFDESLNSNNVKHPCHAQWFLFWVYASYLNEKFSETEKEYVHSFYSYFPEQCINGKGKNCFTEFCQIYPVRAESREELMMWLQTCENYCRQKAELPVKIFNYNKLLKRWRYDDDYI